MEKVLLKKEKHYIPLETQKFILQMCMAQWDGQWFLKTKKEFGNEKANELNQRVVSSFGRILADLSELWGLRLWTGLLIWIALILFIIAMMIMVLKGLRAEKVSSA